MEEEQAADVKNGEDMLLADRGLWIPFRFTGTSSAGFHQPLPKTIRRET